MTEKRIVFQGCKPFRDVATASPASNSSGPRIFLLSPANAGGVRAKFLFAPRSEFDLARRLRGAGAPLGEIFSFISGLYFRGKLAYAEKFSSPPPNAQGIHLITPAAGFMQPQTLVGLDQLKEIVSAAVDAKNPLYRDPLERDAKNLLAQINPETQVVLLGSVASPKYVEPLLHIFGGQLFFPREFVGRGDMSRGGLLLRCTRENTTLTFVPLAGATRSGPRPPKLPRPRKQAKHS